METTSNSDLINSSPPHSHLFKPFLRQVMSYRNLSKTRLRKKHFKYMRSFEANGDKHDLKIISKLKSLFSLHIPGGRRSLNNRLLKKLLKSQKKYLRNLKGCIETPRFQKLLPLLTQLTVAQTPATWRLLTSRSVFKKLIFNLIPKGSPNPNQYQKAVQNLWKEYKARLSRNLSRMRDLNSLEINIPSKNVKLVFSMLEIINEKVNLESLKKLSLSLGVSVRETDSQEAFGPNPINKALEFMTSLSIIDADKYSFLFSEGNFKNLSTLYLYKDLSKEDTCDLRYLASFKDLVKLKKLTFIFVASSFVCCETQFFEHFIVPPSVENLHLDLREFTWNDEENFENNPLYVQFFQKLQSSCQNVKNLNLLRTQGSHLKNRSPLAGKFASLFFQRFSKLETMYFQNSQTGANLEDSQVPPLDLKLFWKALESSKETLVSILIYSQKIAFPEKIEALETRFPKLKKLSLQGGIICPIEFGTLCSKIPSLKEVFVQSFLVIDEKNLKEMLFSLRDIPKEMKVNLTFKVETIKQQQLLIDCLMGYIPQVKSKGVMQMFFRNVQVEDIKAFQKVLNLAREKGCFDNFCMTIGMDQTLFYVTKYVVNRAANGLTF